MQKKDYTLDEWGVLRINEGVTEIEKEAFSRDMRIRRVILPESLREIGEIAFAGCLNLSEVEFNEDLFSIGRKAFYDTGIERLEFKEGPWIVESLAFGFCNQLKQVYFGKKISRVGTFAFHLSALERAVYPEGTGAVSFYSYRNCLNLEHLECDGLDTERVKIKSAERNVVYAFLSASLPKGISIKEELTEYIKTHSEWFAVRAAEKGDTDIFCFLIEKALVSDATFRKLLSMEISAEIKAVILEYMYEKYLPADEQEEL